jgi:hypothetical protein
LCQYKIARYDFAGSVCRHKHADSRSGWRILAYRQIADGDCHEPLRGDD